MNTAEFKSEMVRHGDTLSTLSEKLNLSTVSLSLKINGKREFRQSEISKIKELYSLEMDRVDAIFFSVSAP